jgi:prepilin-type N-terminal cleavage/methylation domain-containing protein
MKKTNKGFTIIEVVLVLAIAGLIFLIVFLALPALQRSQRDTQRRSDIGRSISAVQTSQSNNNGTLPTMDALFISTYLSNGGSSFTDPSGGPYTFATFSGTPTATPLTGQPTITATATNDTNGQLAVVSGRTCNGTVKSNALSIIIKLESGGFYCANN